MFVILYFFAVLSSAGLLALAIPNEFLLSGSSILGIVSLIPLYTAFIAGKSKKAIMLMYGFFVPLLHLLSSFWLAYFGDFAIFTLGASTLAYFFLALPFGIAFYYFSRLKIPYRIFGFALTWSLWEYFKSTGFLGYPWGTVAMSATKLTRFIQIVDITGVWGISFLIPLISACLAETILAAVKLSNGFAKESRRPLVRTLIFVAFLVLSSICYGQYKLTHTQEPEKKLNIAVIQQNADPWDMSNFEQILLSSELLSKRIISEASEPTDLIIWSESSLSYPYQENKYYYEIAPAELPVTDFLKEVDTPLFSGSPLLTDPENDGYSNAVSLILPDASVAESYAKMQMVPFAEYIPGINNPLVKKLFSAIVGFSSGWVPGTECKLFSLQTKNGESVRFATPICYEDAFPSVCAHLHQQGSELLINLTNDSWSKTASAEYQHYAVAMYRTIELRTSMIRSTNSGYTVAINPYGKTIASLPLFVQDGFFLSMPVYPHTMTFYARYKDWLPLLLFCTFLVCMLSLKKEKHKNLLLKSAEKNIAEMKYKSVFIKKESDTTVWF
ncbi:apolipoprotein N-acyltransferase [Treponema phagedenis]|uniref:apolipoprotein N-acyltransferase n=1 Tax=Treponema phagedenis TaxID=162 RepID=UPI0011E6155C|nr:apolipoprotein N-acyltransferase [Treponema phagedenis]QEK04104.1 apolipoprotein N-acyltransferase [Treponema phagedenis]QEK09719.1 apolipoprotein N-acyltransferase [Treponema phagedenis]